MRGRRYLPGVAAGALVLTAMCVDTERPPLLELGDLPSAAEPAEELSGGATTVADTGVNAFGRSLMNMPLERWPDFYESKQLFGRDWREVKESPVLVGPLFSASSCMTCHVKDGRGRPPASPDEAPVSLVFQLSAPGGQGPHPSYGEQLDLQALQGSEPEGTVAVAYDELPGEFATGESFTLLRPRYTFKSLVQGPLGADAPFSPRVSPANFGMGLLDAIPEEALLTRADPDDANQDGISGRPNRVRDVETGETKLGRFGWKANQPSLRQQIAHALSADMGLTTSLYPQPANANADGTGTPEVTPQELERLLFYMRLVAVPKRRDWDAPAVLRGKAVFRAIGCSGCHVDSAFETGDVPGLPELSHQRIYPYTDLLLHDLGEGLADGRPDGQASGREWRTPPLWGIGLVETVNGHTRFLHDGRARNHEEAVLWHGGEAAPARERYVRLPHADREALLAFLKSL
ncbi:di-heme oxidoredictase family protein [Myxococcus sp. RHSTA-1-4]|uniref:di-heme oxidoreductase family protein n=1 Tax=Myxococcus sp. RHSTA-1-4 TaxID=2874601 RepID=UPI001CECC842|nr:di-heme oxidoredictase family protein [Myxococcus sp. RHSTA-1-4]MBZ4418970.1 c-type cytochrome [Myxococcus sp. RHSTA-1-4]